MIETLTHEPVAEGDDLGGDEALQHLHSTAASARGYNSPQK